MSAISKLSGYDYDDPKHGYTVASRVGWAESPDGKSHEVWQHKHKGGQFYTGQLNERFTGNYKRFAGTRERHKAKSVVFSPARQIPERKVRHGFLKLRTKTIPGRQIPERKTYYVDDVAKREAERSAAIGGLGALVLTRRLRPTLGWSAAGGTMGGGMDVVRRRRRRTTEAELLHVAKRRGDQLYRKETRTSPWRATEALAGVTLLTTGGSRLKLVGAGLKAGTKLPGNRGLLFERAQSIRNTAQRGTRMVGPTMRRVPEVSGAIDLVPGRLRPVAATVVGAGLVSHARPVRREKYVPTVRTY